MCPICFLSSPEGTIFVLGDWVWLGLGTELMLRRVELAGTEWIAVERKTMRLHSGIDWSFPLFLAFSR